YRRGTLQEPLLGLFIFQAEDGIRARNVTGVQTCALPISNIGNLNREIRAANRLMKSIRQLIQNLKGWITELGEKRKELLAQKARSEERRVGKACGERRAGVPLRKQGEEVVRRPQSAAESS